MKPFFLQSLFLHGLVLGLLFSWENPLPGKFPPGEIIRVELVEKEEKAGAGVEKEAARPPEEKTSAPPPPAPLPAPQEKKTPVRKRAALAEPSPRKPAPPEPRPEAKPRETGPVPNRLPETLSFAEAAPREEPPEPGLGEPPGAAGQGEFPPGGSDSPPEPLPAFSLRQSGPEAGKPESGAVSGEWPEGNGAAGASPEGARIFASGPEEISGPGGGPAAGFGGRENSVLPKEAAGSAMADADGDAVLLKIIRRIEQAKRYPRAARRMGIEGKTVVRFRLKPGGQVEAAEVAESSGFAILDQASLETVRGAAPLPYKEGWLKVGIVFKIL